MRKIAGILCGSIATLTIAADAPPLSPEQYVNARRSAYYLSGALVSDMKTAVEAGANPKDQSFAAQAIAKWARTLPTLFPAGSNVAPTRATEKVWSDRPGFESHAQAYAQAADKLADVASSGDRAAFLTQLQTMRDTCHACHLVYHKQEETSDGKH